MGHPGEEAQPAMIPGRNMTVLYGSETGNAEEIARELGNMAERLHFQTSVDEMDSFKLADVLRSSLVIFVTSTTGQGDMPKNTLKFWKNLRREKLTNTNCLRSLRFAIFGLGDSSYLKFNWSARKLRARLLQLGAAEFFRPGEGDERHDNGIDSIYFPWFEELKSHLLANYPLPESITPIPDDVQLPPKYPLELLPAMASNAPGNGAAHATELAEAERRFLATRTKSAARSHIDHPESRADRDDKDWRRLDVGFPADVARRDQTWEQEHPRQYNLLDKDNILKDHPEKYLLETTPLSYPERCPPEVLLPIPGTWPATVTRHVRVTPPDHWQDVRHFSFEIAMENKQFQEILPYAGGMTLVIYPKNYPEDVDELISMMGWEAEADRPFSARRLPRGVYPPSRTPTLRELLTHNMDITAVPKRSFIRDLVYFTKDEREQERLLELTAPGNEQEFYDYTCRPRRTILELLRDFVQVKIPLIRVLDLFPVIRGREFSVCNGAMTLSGGFENAGFVTIEILAALVEYKTIIRKPRQGLCSRYLKCLRLGTELTVLLKPSSGPPLVPNAEWAQRPMIAVATGTGIAPIRAVIQERSEYNVVPGETLLFFGCRNRDADFYFEHEWDSYPSVKIFPAFSRDRIEPEPGSTTTITGPAVEDGTAEAISAIYSVQYDAHKNYVQHLIRKYAVEVGSLMLQNPIVCVCGNAGRMPMSVRAALMDALVISKVVENAEEAEKWIRNPENVTYWQETW